jgi:hypothetical protein
MLHSLVDALRDGLAAHREYERLIAMGMCHDPALRAALSKTGHSGQACARYRRRQQKLRLDQRLRRDSGLVGVGVSPRSG